MHHSVKIITQRISTLTFCLFIFSVGYAQNTITTEGISLHPNGPNITIDYILGDKYFLPSLLANSYLHLDQTRKYSDLWLGYNSMINENVSFSLKLELTNLPRQIIGTNHSRDDYIISTGRFQESVLNIIYPSLEVKIGRTNFFIEDYKPSIYPLPVNGDGLGWVYSWDNYSFKHVIETLPAEKASSSSSVFRRLLSYHHISTQIRDLTLGVGELFILTGYTIGLDFKRLNPFIPFSRNSHDSYRDYYDGYEGDSDNTIIKGFAKYHKGPLNVDLYMYIDEFQVDQVDRETKSDALLINLNIRYEAVNLNKGPASFAYESTFSLSNPNFGDHPGPFTTASSAGYPLLQFSPGMVGLGYLQFSFSPHESKSFYFSVGREYWKNLSSIPREFRNSREILDSLPLEIDDLYQISYEQYLFIANTKCILQLWHAPDTKKPDGISVSFSYALK